MNDHERELVAGLKDHPAWDALERLSKEREFLVYQTLARELMHGARSIDAQGLTEYVLYARGMLRGMQLLIRQPDITAKQIERELAKAKEEHSGEEK